MDIVETILKNNKYNKLIDQMSDKILISVVKDGMIALETASKCIAQVEPGKINDVKYLQDAADATQKLAQKVLEERTKK